MGLGDYGLRVPSNAWQAVPKPDTLNWRRIHYVRAAKEASTLGSRCPSCGGAPHSGDSRPYEHLLSAVSYWCIRGSCTWDHEGIVIKIHSSTAP